MCLRESVQAGRKEKRRGVLALSVPVFSRATSEKRAVGHAGGAPAVRATDVHAQRGATDHFRADHRSTNYAATDHFRSDGATDHLPTDHFRSDHARANPLPSGGASGSGGGGLRALPSIRECTIFYKFLLFLIFKFFFHFNKLKYEFDFFESYKWLQKLLRLPELTFEYVWSSRTTSL